MTFVDPGDQKRGRSRKPAVRAPDAPNLFDISRQAPPTPIQVTSSTSIDAAKEIKQGTKTKRRDLVFKMVKGSPHGLARFQIAAAMGVQDHVISSSVDALVKMRKIEEHPTRTIENPASGKHCAVLVWIDSGEMEGAA
jgi:hypothetical protein